MTAMSRPVLILLAIALASVAIFAWVFLFASKASSRHLSRPTDELEWLQTEFRLGKAEMERVRELHNRYLPVCQSFCDQIAREKRSLQQLVEQGQGTSEAARQRLDEIARLRASCQAAMLQHFEEVSRVMPPEEGRRYLKEMRRFTLGVHEQIEESMSGVQGDEHAHH
jgi:HAMP domain-containing protein